MPNAPGTVLISDVQLSCSSLTFTVITYEAVGGVIGDEIGQDSKDYTTRLPAVQQLTLTSEDNKVTLSWAPQDIAVECELKYKVNVDDRKSLICDPSADCSFHIGDGTDEVDLAQCETVTITVTAVNSDETDIDADSSSYDFTPPIKKVTVFETKRADNTIKTTFTPLSDLPTTCGDVEYVVTQVDEQCFKSKVFIEVVSPSNENAASQSQPKEFNKGPGRVVNLEYKLESDKVDITWDIPVDGKDCSLWYTVKYNDGTDDKVVTTHLTSMQVPNVATACTTNPITVEASNGEAGPETTLNVEGAFGAVQNMQCDYGTNDDKKKVSCKWTAPAKTDGCADLQYNIRYSSGKEGEEDKVDSTKGTQFDFFVEKCENIWIQVTPTIKDREGVSVDKVLEDRVLDCNPPASKTWWKSFV